MPHVVIEFQKAVAKRNATDRHYCRLAALAKLFWMEHLRFASSTAELVDWARSSMGRGEEINPASVLTQGEMANALAEARRARQRARDFSALKEYGVAK